MAVSKHVAELNTRLRSLSATKAGLESFHDPEDMVTAIREIHECLTAILHELIEQSENQGREEK